MEEDKLIILRCSCGEQYSVKANRYPEGTFRVESNVCPICNKKGDKRHFRCYDENGKELKDEV